MTIKSLWLAAGSLVVSLGFTVSAQAMTPDEMQAAINRGVCPANPVPYNDISYERGCGANYMKVMTNLQIVTCQNKVDHENRKVANYNDWLRSCKSGQASSDFTFNGSGNLKPSNIRREREQSDSKPYSVTKSVIGSGVTSLATGGTVNPYTAAAKIILAPSTTGGCTVSAGIRRCEDEVPAKLPRSQPPDESQKLLDRSKPEVTVRSSTATNNQLVGIQRRIEAAKPRFVMPRNSRPMATRSFTSPSRNVPPPRARSR